MTTVAEETALAFLRQVPPFDLLDEGTLLRVARASELRYFPKGTVIIRRGGPAATALFVIERGGVRRSVPTPNGDPALVDVCGEGELFGILSAIDGGAARFDVEALEDTLCYALPRSLVDELMVVEPAFAQFFVRFSIERYLDRSLAELRQSQRGIGVADPLIFTTPLRQIASRPLLTCAGSATIEEAATLMSERKMSSIVVLGDVGQAVGIVTDRDLRTRVIAAHRDTATKIAEIMSALTLTVDADELITEAIRIMLAGNVNHLVVMADGQPFGMVTSRDVVVAQGSSALSIAREIDRQSDTPGLRSALERSHRMVPYLLAQGVRARTIGHIMAGINDRAIVRVLRLVEAEIGPPPLPYCWIVMGSEGRQEQTFRTDQDNAIVYADPLPEQADSVRDYFLRLGTRAVGQLVDIGFPPCSGRYSADNPAWVQPVTSWRRQFDRWVEDTDLARLLQILIFFDFRGISGDQSLASGLRSYVSRLLAEHRMFLTHLAKVSTYQQPLIGFLGRFIVERGGEHRDELNLKFHGSGLVVNLARFYALRSGIAETSTIGRLEQAAAVGTLPQETAEALAQAYEFLLSLRIRRQSEQLQAGEPPTNHVNPKTLAPLDRTLLREAFAVIARAQHLVRGAYQTADLPD